ncbi:MAG: PH domain-containing protein [Chloroflexota bacterium]
MNTNGTPNRINPTPPPVRRPLSARPRLYAHKIPDLRPGEVVVVLLHRHPVALLYSLRWALLLATLWTVSIPFVAPLLLSLAVDPLLSVNAAPTWLAPLLWAFWLGAAIILACWIGYVLLDWREDWIALTTRRVILMNKKLFFRESRRECPIGKVQNVVAEYPNPVGMAFDFGDLNVDTAGAGTLLFRDLPRPKILREAIFKQQEIQHAKQPPPEDLRKEAIRSIILGQDPTSPGPQPPAQHPRNQDGTSFVSGYGLFNSLFPFVPQRDGRSVTWHKHWSYLLRGVLAPVLLYALVLACWFGAIVLGTPGEVGLIETILGWMALALLPVCAGVAVWNWEDWRNDLYRLDHERVYHIESLPFGLREQSKETLITRITDVMYDVPGPLANLLDYGNVVIKTPGESTEFDFKGIPCPREVQQEIMDRVDRYRQKSAAGTDRDIEAWLRAYHDVTRGA